MGFLVIMAVPVVIDFCSLDYFAALLGSRMPTLVDLQSCVEQFQCNAMQCNAVKAFIFIFSLQKRTFEGGLRGESS